MISNYGIYGAGELADLHTHLVIPSDFRAWTPACYKIKSRILLSLIGGNLGLGAVLSYDGVVLGIDVNNGAIEIEFESTY